MLDAKGAFYAYVEYCGHKQFSLLHQHWQVNIIL